MPTRSRHSLVLSVALALATLVGCRAFSREGTGPRSVAASRQLSRQGATAMERGDWPGAESLLHKAVEACPLDVEARRSYSETLWHRGATGAAIVQLEEARRVAPEDASLAVRAGELYLSLDRLDKAREASDRALDVDPKNAPAWALRGRVMERSGQSRQALAAYQRALGYEPSNADWLLLLAESYRQLGAPSRALAALQTLIDTYPSGEEPQQVLYLQGLALSALGRYNDAAESFATATQRGSPTAELFCRLAEAQLMAGRPADAQSSVQQALALEPAHQGSVLLAQRMQLARGAPSPDGGPNMRR